MKKKVVMVIAIVLVVIVVVAAVWYVTSRGKSKELPISTEQVVGQYNVTLSFFKSGWAQIEYTDETGYHSEQYFEPQMRNGLDWVKNNVLEDATILCWWDYGHEIKGYAERSVIARNPSHEWIGMVAIARTDPGAIKEFDSNERVVDVAKALATSDFSETLQIMEKYGATHIVVYKDDLIKAGWMYKVAGLDPTDFQTQLQNSTWVLNEAGKQTMISRLLDNRDVGVTLIYEDTAMKVYKKD